MICLPKPRILIWQKIYDKKKHIQDEKNIDF